MPNDKTPFNTVGNLAADPELRYTQSGTPVCNARLACTPTSYDKQSGQYKDEPTVYWPLTIWREAAEHASESFQKGSRVIVIGEVKNKPYTDRDGNQRDSFYVKVDEIGPSTRYGTTTFTKATRNNQGAAPRNQGGTPQGAPQGGGDPWASQGTPAPRPTNTQRQPQPAAAQDDPWGSAPADDDPWG